MTSEEFKEKVKQYNYLVKGIKDLKIRIKKIEAQARYVKDSVKGSSKKFPYTEHTCIVEGIEESERLKRREKLLNRKKEELEDLKEELEIYINTQIKDERFRQLLMYKYIDGFSWVKIADKLGGAVSEVSLRKEFERFLKKI